MQGDQWAVEDMICMLCILCRLLYLRSLFIISSYKCHDNRDPLVEIRTEAQRIRDVRVFILVGACAVRDGD